MPHPLEALFLDLDGSLLDNHRRLPPEDRETIAQLIARGVRVCIATGRHYELSMRYWRELGCSGPFLASDGAVVYHPGERRVLFWRPIPGELVREVLTLAIAREEEFYFHALETAYFSPNFGRIGVWQDYAAACTTQDLQPGLGQMPPRYLEGDPQVMTVMFHLPTPEFCRELERLCQGRAPLYLQPEGRVAIISAPGWDKGRGAAWLAQREGFRLENAMALGDTGNDLPLLRKVGWPVVPKNGSPEALALARFVTAENGDSPVTRAVEALFPDYLE